MVASAIERVVTTVESAGRTSSAEIQRFVPTYYVSCGDRLAFQLPHRPGRRYRWRWNEQPLGGGEDGLLVLDNVGTVAAGNYSVMVEEGDSSFGWSVAIVAVVAEAHLTHFSLRRSTGEPDPAMIAGFFIGGAGAKGVELRCSDPAGSELVLAGWDGQRIASARAGSEGPALEASLESGSYSALATLGSALDRPSVLELTDLDAPVASASISNFSGRVTVDPGPAGLVLGFTIMGTTAATVLIRGVGPSLANLFALPGALTRTQIILRNEGGRVLASNSGWQADGFLAAAFEQAGAFALAPASEDSALVMTLPPGVYAAELLCRGEEGGIGLIEVYDIPAR